MTSLQKVENNRSYRLERIQRIKMRLQFLRQSDRGRCARIGSSGCGRRRDRGLFSTSSHDFFDRTQHDSHNTSYPEVPRSTVTMKIHVRAGTLEGSRMTTVIRPIRTIMRLPHERLWFQCSPLDGWREGERLSGFPNESSLVWVLIEVGHAHAQWQHHFHYSFQVQFTEVTHIS